MEVQRTDNFGQLPVENNILEPAPNFLNSYNSPAALPGVEKTDSSQTVHISNSLDHERVRAGGTSMSGVNNSNNGFGIDVSSGPLLGGNVTPCILITSEVYDSYCFVVYITICDA